MRWTKYAALSWFSLCTSLAPVGAQQDIVLRLPDAASLHLPQGVARHWQVEFQVADARETRLFLSFEYEGATLLAGYALRRDVGPLDSRQALAALLGLEPHDFETVSDAAGSAQGAGDLLRILAAGPLHERLIAFRALSYPNGKAVFFLIGSEASLYGAAIDVLEPMVEAYQPGSIWLQPEQSSRPWVGLAAVGVLIFNLGLIFYALRSRSRRRLQEV